MPFEDIEVTRQRRIRDQAQCSVQIHRLQSAQNGPKTQVAVGIQQQAVCFHNE